MCSSSYKIKLYRMLCSEYHAPETSTFRYSLTIQRREHVPLSNSLTSWPPTSDVLFKEKGAYFLLFLKRLKCF